MKSIRLHPKAEAEMIDAALWYETQQAELGKRFLASVQDAIGRIRINPEFHTKVEGDVRRCLTKTFPFAILFWVAPEIIVIMAVMHLHRDPDYWKNRRFEEG